MNFRPENFIPVYPSQNDPNIQTLTTNKKEFLEKKALLFEPEPKKGEKYNNQEFFLRYMIPYDKIFIIDDTGTGKSCKFNNLASYFRKYLSVYKRVYILEKGQNTIDDMAHQIVYRCSSDYETEAIRNPKSEKSLKMNIKKEISKWITLETYGDFVKPIIEKNFTDQNIIDTYSDSIFLIDEVHNLSRNDKNDVNIYNVIWRVFHLAKRSKFCIASATPMINDVSELPRLMNLILPVDQQMPEDWNYKKVTLDQVEPYFRGKITFIRGVDTGINVVYQGIKLNNMIELENGKKIESTTIIYPSQMGKLQKKVYKKTVENNNNGAFYTDLKQISCFVFPDKSYGGNLADPKKGLGKYYDDPDFREMLKHKKELKNMSCKLATIIDIEKKSTGCSFIFSEYVQGGGTLLISLAFEMNGFENFESHSSVFKDGKIIPTFPKKKRYCLLTSSGSSKNSMFQLFNSEENALGEYIQVFITSDTGKEGINVSHIQRGHNFTSEWTSAGTHQSVSRYIRATSHNFLIKKLGYIPEIKIYKHVAFCGNESIDEYIYKLSEDKNIYIQRLARMMVQSSIDARLNYERNVRSKDIDYSDICRYDKCAYECTTAKRLPLDSEIDYSTYDILYYHNEVDKCIMFLKDKLLEKNYVEIGEVLKKFRIQIIYLTIEKINQNKQIINNRFGFETFLNFSEGKFHFGEKFSVCENKLLIEFSEKIKVNEQTDIIEQIKNLNYSLNQQKQLDDLTILKLRNLLMKLKTENLIKILEQSVIKYKNKITPENYEKILLRFYSFFICDISPGVYIHFLNTLQVKESKHNIYSTLFNVSVTIRILKTDTWRDCTDEEQIIYREYIQKHISDKIKEQSQNDIYGIIFQDGIFRIFVKDFQKKNRKVSNDKSLEKRGKQCEKCNIYELTYIFLKENITTPEIDEIEFNISDKDELIDYLEANLPKNPYLNYSELKKKKLLFLCKLIESKMTKENMCKLIQNDLFSKNKLIRLTIF